MNWDALGDLNWLAVLVATLAYFALGALWYAPPVFGKAWIRASGIEMPAEGEGPGSAIYVVPLISNLVAAVATGALAEATASNDFGEGLTLGLIVGVGYAASLSLLGAVFDTQKPEPRVWFLINSAYHLVGLAIVGVIVSIWD